MTNTANPSNEPRSNISISKNVNIMIMVVFLFIVLYIIYLAFRFLFRGNKSVGMGLKTGGYIITPKSRHRSVKRR